MAVNEKSQLEAAVRRSLEELGGAVVPWMPAPLSPPAAESGNGKGGEAAKGRKKQTVPEEAVQVMDRICRFPEEYIEERYGALGFDRNQEYRARSVLETRGMLRLAGKIGKWQFFEPSEKGLEWAKSRGIGVAKFKSDVLHEAIRRRTVRSMGTAVRGLVFRPPKAIHGVQPDALAVHRSGLALAIQVSVTNRPEYEASCALKLVEPPGVDRVILVTAAKGKAEQIALMLRKLAHGGSGQHAPSSDEKAQDQEKPECLKKLIVMDAATVLGPNFDWNVLIGNLAGEKVENEQL